MSNLDRHIIFILFLSLSCSKNPHIPKERVLVQIDDHIITEQEFIKRAEYTIRPAYCRQSNYIHKKIVLNSLIAEKLTAIEAEKKQIESDQNFYLYLKGRKEQAMRQVNYNDNHFSKVILSDEEKKTAYHLAGRNVSVQYLNLPTRKMALSVMELIQDGESIDSIYNEVWGGQAPKKNINWFDREDELIHQSIFHPNINKGDLVGPFAINDSSFLIMLVEGWSDEISLSEKGQMDRWNNVVEQLSEKKAKKSYLKWVRELMSGKEIVFNPDIFYTYVEQVSEYYFKVDSTKKDAISSTIWNDYDNAPVFNYDKANKIDLNDILFTYKGSPWSINDFLTKLKSHPLVFRKRKMKRSEFPEQFKFAVADLLQDLEITNFCYAQNIDNHWIVKSHVKMWQDANLSNLYLSNRRMKNPGIIDQNEWLELMNPVIDSLQSNYSNQIMINMELFESILLTSTDMVVSQRGVPYSTVVPSFPIITTDKFIDYGTRMNP